MSEQYHGQSQPHWYDQPDAPPQHAHSQHIRQQGYHAVAESLLAHQPAPHHAPPARHDDPRRRVENSKREPAGRAAGQDYTLQHRGRQVRIGPVAFWTCVGTLVIMAGWSAVTATYFAFRDDVLTRLIVRQTDMQFAYEDRIAEMRAQVDRVTSRQLLDQEQFEQKLDTILRRQVNLEGRASSLGALNGADPTPTGSIRQPSGSGAQKPSPLSGASNFTVQSVERQARLDSSPVVRAVKAAGSLDGMLARLQDSLDRVETRQNSSLASMSDGVQAKVTRMRSVLTDLGLSVAKPPAETGIGGPFVPVRLASAAPFEQKVYQVHATRAYADRLVKTLDRVPIRKPVDGELDESSGFGVRNDPFIGRPAMHTGMDFRGDTGEPVRVTAAGTVSKAGWMGGYGNLVEVDHGNGLSTRYGHLSAIDVKVGQAVRTGQAVGKLGSTGRSTGPHIHYETRVDGDAVNPEKFLRAGGKLGKI
jgi:murein DD-endopeptidase MepM/ murein hydrolase activator NlpD